MESKYYLVLFLSLVSFLFILTNAVPLTIINAHSGHSETLSSYRNGNNRPIFTFNRPKDTPMEAPNPRPIIGIVTEELTESMEEDFGYLNYTSFIAASYVKFVEAGGARVAPVFINQSDEYYEYLGRTLNGFLFPGGALGFDSGYSQAASKLYEIATRDGIEDDKRVAIWGTCLGFENIIYFEAGYNPLVYCEASNSADKLYFQEGYEDSKLLSNVLDEVVQDLATKNITANFHHKCILPETFNEIGLNNTLRMISTSFDFNGTEYVSTIEHRQFPIFGTQWHPEKADFEWIADSNHDKIPHSLEASRATNSMAESFIQFARMNTNKFELTEEEERSLIYNYSPTYTGKNDKYIYELCYFF